MSCVTKTKRPELESLTWQVWDVMTGQCLHVLDGHFHQIYSIALQWEAPEGQPPRIVTGSLDASVRVWHAVTG